ncbi:hypothetical protein thsps21_06370 [Pseudomonas sp. No.21]|nr:hypothetical protein TUM20249_04650 [Pseudomonas tohonis]
MQGGGAGPGVDLGAQADHAEFGQGYPFTQADHGELVERLQSRLSGKVVGILVAPCDNCIRPGVRPGGKFPGCDAVQPASMETEA